MDRYTSKNLSFVRFDIRNNRYIATDGNRAVVRHAHAREMRTKKATCSGSKVSGEKQEGRKIDFVFVFVLAKLKKEITPDSRV